MRMAFLALLPAIAACASSGTVAKTQATWQSLASCAAAYRANADHSEPGRSTSMKAQISETADDYEKAAVARYRARAKVDEPAGRAAIQAYVASRSETFGRRPRRQVEQFIDACPQTDG